MRNFPDNSETSRTCSFLLKKKGFTLAEVFIALILFAATVAIFSETIRNTFIAFEKVEFSDSSSNVQTLVRKEILSILDVDILESGGVMRVRDLDIYWKAEIFPVELLDTWMVSILYESKGSLSSSQQQMDLFLYRPSWSVPEDRMQLKEIRFAEWEDAYQSEI